VKRGGGTTSVTNPGPEKRSLVTEEKKANTGVGKKDFAAERKFFGDSKKIRKIQTARVEKGGQIESIIN